MAEYPGVDDERRFAHDVLAGVVADIFRRCGTGADDADLLSEHLVRADLRGIHSHGVMRVPGYAERLVRRAINPTGRPRVAKDRAGALVIDGDNSMGQIGGTFAMRHAIGRARATGVCVATVGHSNHAGAMEYYARMAVEAGMIGIATTNALPTMAPWGGIDKLVGLNPLAIGFPAGDEQPLLLDVALGATAHGKMQIYKQKGAPIPAGWAFDRQGRPTTEIDAALEGLVQPIGRHKGIGLAMSMGILSTLLCDAGYGTESGNMVEGPQFGRDGQFYMALDIAAFEDVARFKQRMDKIIREYRSTRLAEGVERVYVPGEIEDTIERRNRRDGVPLNEQTVRNLTEAARSVGADATALG
jgi:LDH2 family malate/lactate/ureidoglycolate dehydrogenase